MVREVQRTIDRGSTVSRLADSPNLLERGPLLEQFEAIFAQAVPSHNGCLSIEGEWGQGKTTLLNAACFLAEKSSCFVVRARGGELEQHRPFGVLLRMVEVISTQLVSNVEIADHVEALNDALAGYSAEEELGGVGAAFYELLLALRRLGPVLLALDDGSLADGATLQVLQYVFNRVDDQQIWLLITSSPRTPGTLSRFIDHLLINPHVRHFVLTSLTMDSVRCLVAQSLGEDPEQEFLERFFEATAGRPEFVVELARACRDEHVSPRAINAAAMTNLAFSRFSPRVLVRLERLPAIVVELLEACAVNGDATDLATACHLANMDSAAVERAADLAATAGLLRFRRPLSFVAPLVRWAILNGMSPARRSHLHGQCASYLSEVNIDDRAAAEHLLAIEPSGNLSLAARLTKIGRNLMVRGDSADAARCLRRALVESPLSGQDGALWLDLARCEADVDVEASLGSFARSLALTPADLDRVTEVAIAIMRKACERPELRDAATKTFEALETMVGGVDVDLQLEFSLGLASLGDYSAQREARIARIESLLSRTAQSDPGAGLARAYLSVHRIESESDLSADRIVDSLGPLLDPERVFSDVLADDLLQWQACRILLSADGFTHVDPMLDVARRRAQQLGEPSIEGEVLRLLLLSKLWQGALAEAESVYRRHHEVDRDPSTRPLVGVIGLLLAQGRTEEAQRAAASFDPERIELPLERAEGFIERGRLYATCGDFDRALGEFVRANHAAARAGVTNQVIVGWRPPAVASLVSLDRWSEARSLAEENLESARAFGATRSLGAALRAMAVASRETSERIEWYAQSVDVLEKSPARLDAAESMIGMGAVYIERQEFNLARGLLREGADLASACGARRLVETAGSYLRSAGARPRRLGLTGVDSLTPAEVRAVNMAAANVANRAIADELFVTVKTVEGHLSRAYKKLGVTSRSELAQVLWNSGQRHREEVSEVSGASETRSLDRP